MRSRVVGFLKKFQWPKIALCYVVFQGQCTAAPVRVHPLVCLPLGLILLTQRREQTEDSRRRGERVARRVRTSSRTVALWQKRDKRPPGTQMGELPYARAKPPRTVVRQARAGGSINVSSRVAYRPTTCGSIGYAESSVWTRRAQVQQFCGRGKLLSGSEKQGRRPERHNHGSISCHPCPALARTVDPQTTCRAARAL